MGLKDVTRVIDLHNQAGRNKYRAAQHKDEVVRQMWHYVQHLAADHMDLTMRTELQRRWYKPKRNAKFDRMLEESFEWLEQAYAMTEECDPYEHG